jgi:hypothetical protein
VGDTPRSISSELRNLLLHHLSLTHSPQPAFNMIRGVTNSQTASGESTATAASSSDPAKKSSSPTSVRQYRQQPSRYRPLYSHSSEMGQGSSYPLAPSVTLYSQGLSSHGNSHVSKFDGQQSWERRYLGGKVTGKAQTREASAQNPGKGI